MKEHPALKRLNVCVLVFGKVTEPSLKKGCRNSAEKESSRTPVSNSNDKMFCSKYFHVEEGRVTKCSYDLGIRK